jgi:hypothetical protein
MAHTYGLKEPKPNMCSTRQSGNALYLVESEDKFYIWDQMEHQVFHVESPTTENAIRQSIKDDGFKKLKLKVLDPTN